MKNADGQHNSDGSFSFDYEKISRETGWSVDEIKARGVSWCRRNSAARLTALLQSTNSVGD